MIEYMREYVVRQEQRGQFELAFGPGGAWSRLFARSPGFRGTTLLRDQGDLVHYLMIEIWDSPAHREQALAARQADYEALLATLSEWVQSQRDLGAFRLLAQTTVRPRPGVKRGKSRKSPHDRR